MGGSGSGNRFNHGFNGRKDTVEDCRTIDAGRWTREGVIKAGACQTGFRQWTCGGDTFTIHYTAQASDLAEPRLSLWYSWRGEWVAYTAGLTATRPHFGGLRWWFRCPLVRGGRPCGRRVGKLHMPPGSRNFGCRQCHGLTYTSCQESHKHDTALRMLAGGLGLDMASVKGVMRELGSR